MVHFSSHSESFPHFRLFRIEDVCHWDYKPFAVNSSALYVPSSSAVAVLYLILSRCSRAGLWLWVLLSAALVGICKMAYPSTDLNTSNDRTETRTIICDEVMSCGKVNVF